MRHGRGHLSTPFAISSPLVVSDSLTLEIETTSSRGRLGSLTLDTQSEGGSDSAVIASGVTASGSVGALSFAVDSPTPSSTFVLNGVRAGGRVGNLTVQGTAQGWALTEEPRSPAFLRLESYTLDPETGRIDFAPILSEWGHWLIEDNERGTIIIRSEASISADTDAQRRP